MIPSTTRPLRLRLNPQPVLKETPQVRWASLDQLAQFGLAVTLVLEPNGVTGRVCAFASTGSPIVTYFAEPVEGCPRRARSFKVSRPCKALSTVPEAGSAIAQVRAPSPLTSVQQHEGT